MNIKPLIAAYQLNLEGRSYPYGVGCAWLGQGYPDREQVAYRRAALDTAYELGFRYFDTARAYGDSEWVVGEFVASVPRESIWLATKFNLPPGRDLRARVEQVRAFLDQSLQRLRTPYLDLYQIHDTRDMDPIFAAGGVLEFLLEAREQGLIRHIGMAIRDQDILGRALDDDRFDAILTWGDFSPFNQSGAGIIARAAALGRGVINGSPLYDARRRGLNLSDPEVLATVIQYPGSNPAIDITLSGPSNREEILSTARAIRRALDSEILRYENEEKKDA